jgi:hypothetical protein
MDQLSIYVDIKEKCNFLKKLTCKKGTLREMFIRVYRLEIQSVLLVFSTQLCELLPLQPSLWFNSPPPHASLCEYTKYCKYTVLYSVAEREVWGSGPPTDKHLPQSPFTVQFF